MRHEYLKLVPENITVTFTDIHFSKRMGESITVHLERPNENGFNIAEFGSRKKAIPLLLTIRVAFRKKN